jgi:hypothetical protein
LNGEIPTSAPLLVDFWRKVVGYVKTAVPFLGENELLHPSDLILPYDERYFRELEAVIKQRAKQLHAMTEKDNHLNPAENQDQRELFPPATQASTLDTAETRDISAPMVLDHQLAGISGSQERLIDQTVSDSYEVGPNTGDQLWLESREPDNQSSMQEVTSFPVEGIEMEVTQHPSTQFNLQELSYPQTGSNTKDRRAIGGDNLISPSQTIRAEPVLSPSVPSGLVCPACHEQVKSLSRLMCGTQKSFTEG